MGQLIQNLQRLSQITRAPLHSGQVEMRQLVDEAWAALQAETLGREIQWEVDPLPKVNGDPSLLGIVWANLLGNALKYTRPRSQAAIHVGCEPDPQDPHWVIFVVRDNGVGFDMKDADKLFEVVQHLPGTPEFEGAGIGLATVQRIVRRHGGKVWAEAQPDIGATFYFSLPYLSR
jgi:light-regulated signal transduction histidine kinase (bacteriophytochrome)